MADEIKYKKKELARLIAEDNERELCFLMLYWVYEKDAYSNLVIKKADKIATYSTEAFIDYEFRTGSREYTLELVFQAKQQDYRNVDVLSFLVTSLQHYFPEYTCAGRLV